jgi:hypothetical protein
VNSSGNETIRANTNNSAVARANITNNRREWKPIIFLLINKPRERQPKSTNGS